MFGKPEILTIASSLAVHAAERQALVAQNVANADTPGYAAKDIDEFAAFYQSESDFGMARTRAGHIGGVPSTPPLSASSSLETSPNGNSVSLEGEMVKAAEVQREHDLAIAVYGKSLDILRASLGRR